MNDEMKLIVTLQAMARLGYATSRPKIFVAGLIQSAHFKQMFQGFENLPLDTEPKEQWFAGNSEFIIDGNRLKKTLSGFEFNVDKLDECYVQDTVTFGRLSIRFLTLTGLFALRYLQCRKKNRTVPIEELLVFVPSTSLIDVHRCILNLGARVEYAEFLDDIEVFKELDDSLEITEEVEAVGIDDDDEDVINP